MQITIMHKLTGVCLVTGLSIFGMIACNSDDYRSSGNSSDSSTTAGGVNANDNTKVDTNNMATAKTATAVHKKRKTSIMMPMGKEKMMMDKEGVYNNAEVMPEFPGGQDALANYVNSHIEYPQQAIDRNTTGTVKVSFVVDEKGKVTKAQLMNANGEKVGNGLDEEALRVVNMMPAWKPGKVKGKTVKTRLELPITFQFEA